MLKWYDRYPPSALDALEDHRHKPHRLWNRISDDVREKFLDIAQAQRKAKVQPNRLLDHSDWQAMVTIGRTAHRALIAYGIN